MGKVWMPAGALALGLALAACSAGHRITRFDPGKKIEDEERAAYYALPRTLLQLTFKVKKTIVEDKGCFLKVLGQNPLPWSGVPVGRSVGEALGISPDLKVPPVFSVDGPPELAILAEPDPDQVFRAELDSSPLFKRKIELVLGPLGVLQSGTSMARDRTADWVLAGVQAAGASTKILGRTATSDVFAVTACDEPRERLLETVKSIQALESAVDGGSIDRATASWLGERYRARIDQIVAGLVKREETPATIICLVQPGKNGNSVYPVLELDPRWGFQERTSRRCSIPAEFLAPEPDCVLPVKFAVTVERNPNQLVDRYEEAGLGKLPPKNTPQGFYYRIPAVARVAATSVEEGKATQLFVRDVVIAQLGIVAALPEQDAVETQYDVTLDPLTGALTKLVATSEAADPKLLTDLGSAVEKERKEAADAEKAAAAASDELALLERERKLLDEQLKIRELKEKLGIDTP